MRTIHGISQDILVHLPKMTDTRGDELKAVGLPLKVAAEDSPLALHSLQEGVVRN